MRGTAQGVGDAGYAVRGTNHDHSGQAYRLKCGDEYVKIDVLSASLDFARTVSQPLLRTRSGPFHDSASA